MAAHESTCSCGENEVPALEQWSRCLRVFQISYNLLRFSRSRSTRSTRTQPSGTVVIAGAIEAACCPTAATASCPTPVCCSTCRTHAAGTSQAQRQRRAPRRGACAALPTPLRCLGLQASRAPPSSLDAAPRGQFEQDRAGHRTPPLASGRAQLCARTVMTARRTHAAL